MISTSFGAIVFLAFVALATHTLLGLYATSVITSVAWDDARLIADHPDDPVESASAQQDARQRLQGFKNVSVDVDQSNGDVAFHVAADRPNFLPAGMARFSRIDRTIHVRAERLQ